VGKDRKMSKSEHARGGGGETKKAGESSGVQERKPRPHLAPGCGIADAS